jgi:hypothetical protein
MYVSMFLRLKLIIESEQEAIMQHVAANAVTKGTGVKTGPAMNNKPVAAALNNVRPTTKAASTKKINDPKVTHVKPVSY